MKITKSQLKQIIKEELEAVLAEQLPKPEKSEEQKCTDRGGKWKLHPDTDQMKCVLPAGSEEELESVLSEIGEFSAAGQAQQKKKRNIEPMGFAEAPEKINKNVREAAMLADLLKYYKPENRKKQKPPRGWGRQPGLSYRELVQLDDEYMNQLKRVLQQDGADQPSDHHMRKAVAYAGQLGGDGGFLKKFGGAGARRWHSPELMGNYNAITGLTPEQKRQLWTLLSKSGWGFKLMADDPVREEWRKWLGTRMGRGKKSSGWKKSQQKRLKGGGAFTKAAVDPKTGEKLVR